MNNKPENSRETRRFAGNLISIFSSDVVNRGTTFVIYIMVSRELGTLAFGQLSLALALFYSFQTVAAFGLQQFITREVAKETGESQRYFTNALIIGLITSTVGTALMMAMTVLLDYSPGTQNLILVISLGIIPFVISSICDSMVRGWEKMHLIAFAQIPANAIKVVATTVVIYSGEGVLEVIAVLAGTQFLIAAILFSIVAVHLRGFRWNAISFQFAWDMAKRSATFMGIDAAVAWWTSLNLILLSKITSEVEVGIYNAAVQLLIPLAIFIQCVMTSSYPLMCRRFARDADNMHEISNHLMELLFVIVIPGSVGLFMLADPLLILVYGSEAYAASASVLRIIVAVVLLTSLSGVMGQLLLAGNRERTTLRIVLVDLISALILGWALISNFGLTGAALAALLTRVIDFAQHWKPVSQLMEQISLSHLLWKPALASAVMAIYLTTVSQWHPVILVISAAGVYAIIYLLIESWVAGGFRNLRARYL
ncbi:flippase [Mariniblastus sp.]|nr:flippase [Mariniblastus sp.]